MKLLGKKVLSHVYWHYTLTSQQDSIVQEKIVQAEQLANLTAGTNYNIIKFNVTSNTLSLLSYPNFFDEPFPVLARSWRIDLISQHIETRHYANSYNPPILHRKEQFIPTTHPRRAEFIELTKTAEQLGLFDNTLRIGFKRAWEDLIAERGFQLIGSEFVPLANVETVESSTLIIETTTEIARHLTALSRTNLSAPMQCLARYGFLNGDNTLFDYGCGKGDDLRNLRDNNISANGWDPYYLPDAEKLQADLVNVGFVINVIENFVERETALKNAYSLANKLLVVSAMLLNQNAYNGEKLNDGVRTQRNTFQKYYSQPELKTFLEDTLNTSAIAVAPGIFFIFKDSNAEQDFLLNRQRRRGNVLRVTSHYSKAPKLTKSDRLFEKYKQHETLLESLWMQCLELGRVPDKSECVSLVQITATFGTVSKAMQFLGQIKDFQLLEMTRQNRIDDLLTYFALQVFAKRHPYRHLNSDLQRDIKAFFGDYSNAQRAAQEALFSIANTEEITAACETVAEEGSGYLDAENALYVHSELIETLPPILRIYIGCAAMLYGDTAETDLIKIHSGSGKLTLLKYDFFENSPLPKLVERVKINLRAQDFQLFQYNEEFPANYLYLKSRYINEEFPNYAEQVAFDEQLEALNLLNLNGYGDKPAIFEKKLKSARWEINGFQLQRSQTIPDLDDLCGDNLTYRQLIECGETQTATGLSNLPKQPDSYTALYELAKNILDPVIEYFGMIQMSYGFCSHELSKKIPERIAPKLDQHCAHELNSKKNLICERLGAAVDFIIEDENMNEVAEWIIQNTPFDRLYFYGEYRPIHVSYSSEPKGECVHMIENKAGKLVPRVVTTKLKIGGKCGL
jgi:DNA phosphorothioation-associated putative methyltransferase